MMGRGGTWWAGMGLDGVRWGGVDGLGWDGVVRDVTGWYGMG